MSRALIAIAFVAGSAHASETWLPTVDEAVATAKKSNKPVFLVFRCER